MNNPPGWRFTCYIRLKDEPDSKWRDVRAIGAWTNGDMDFGMECVRNEPLRRFVSAAARAGHVLGVRLATPKGERVREMYVGRYKNQGANRALDGFMRFEFHPATLPKSSRLVTVKMISD